MFLQKRPALPEARPQRVWTDEARSTWHLATPLPRGEPTPYDRQRSVPTMRIIIPRQRRTRRVARRATPQATANDGVEFVYLRSGGWLGAIIARLLRGII